MNALQAKQSIELALKRFATLPLAEAALGLFEALGYSSKKRLALKPNTRENFLTLFGQGKTLNDKFALSGEWETIDFLFQLGDDEIRVTNEQFLFDSKEPYSGAVIESYLFLALDLKGLHYTRTELAGMTRELNKLFAMPALVLFRHGTTITFAVINRRLHKKDQARDVLEKVTLIKDIRFLEPHRAHIEILHDLSLGQVRSDKPCGVEVTNFVKLHQAWQKILDIQALNRRFFIEIRNWFYWARQAGHFPAGAKKDSEGRDSEAFIRLLTRSIFCWFLREKGLIPEPLFSAQTAEVVLANWSVAECEKDRTGRFYKAILQNLFFATLATPESERQFRTPRSYQGKNKHYGDQRYFRHVQLFSAIAAVEDLYKKIPFLNGGLFENLDEIPGRDPDCETEIRVDGFSDQPEKQPLVPDFLFFGEERVIPELGPLLGEASSPRCRGLFHIFRDYKFTIEENTPLEEDIALDPELLGRAFENLLAAVNPETGATARKSTGSFYTPREIVQYMAGEALVRALIEAVKASGRAKPGLEERIRELVSEEVLTQRLDSEEADAAVAAVSKLRILDPACGSGAFPMGLLHLLVHVLHKLDPDNERWKAAKLSALPPEMREKAEQLFRDESFNYTRKLELIKDCIYGVDIQPSAIQITKLRFFLSLVIEQKANHHLRPLPNLEVKFVCANSLLPLPKPKDYELFQHLIEPKERELLGARARYFFAPDKTGKDACKVEDRRLRVELSEFIKGIGGDAAEQLASAVASWDPYRRDRRAPYFDPESMFGVRDGFDITIGNPPYVRADEPSEWNQRQRQDILASGYYETLWERWDLYVPFIERSFKLLRPGGVSTLIVSDAFCHSKYAQKAQNWFLKNSGILRLDFCGELKIFDASVHNVITFFQKAEGFNLKPDRRVHHDAFGEVTLLQTQEQTKLTYRAFFPEDVSARMFDSLTLALTDICYVTYGLRPNSDENEAQGEFTTADVVSEVRDKLHCKPYVEGKHLDSWLPRTNLWIEWGTARAPDLFCRPTFPELYTVPEKILAQRSPGDDPVIAYDDGRLVFTPASVGFIPWHFLNGVRNNSLKKTARYKGEKPLRFDLPKREELESTSRRFAVKYLLGVMNSAVARDFLRTNRRSNIHLYPDDWKKLPIPDVGVKEQKPIVNLVDRILDARRKDSKADISELEKELDLLVCRLYGLSPEQSVGDVSAGYSDIKEVLRTQFLSGIAKKHAYFNIHHVREWLKARQIEPGESTLRQYMSELMAGGFIQDAGKGWYSTIEKPFVLDQRPVEEIVRLLKEKYPLLRFGCWSTEQIKGYSQHVFNKFVTFVHVGKDACRPVFESLRSGGWNAYTDLGKKEMRTVFSIGEKTVVIRFSRKPGALPENHLFSIEEILVELHREAKTLSIMDLGEVETVCSRVAGVGRINVGKLQAMTAIGKVKSEFITCLNRLS